MRLLSYGLSVSSFSIRAPSTKSEYSFGAARGNAPACCAMAEPDTRAAPSTLVRNRSSAKHLRCETCPSSVGSTFRPGRVLLVRAAGTSATAEKTIHSPMQAAVQTMLSVLSNVAGLRLAPRRSGLELRRRRMPESSASVRLRKQHARSAPAEKRLSKAGRRISSGLRAGKLHRPRPERQERFQVGA